MYDRSWPRDDRENYLFLVEQNISISKIKSTQKKIIRLKVYSVNRGLNAMRTNQVMDDLA